ncbi:uncharacterized protein [Epargyreus clarus]|uniref:uncharacterized protein isoform X1 n=1 Tax=Epargyreus clarus TaxID=520877 RepID=UPI003C305097
MCVNIEVILPTIETFLLLYSLRSGSIIILLWTIFRTLFCVLFFTMAILEVLVHQSFPFGAWLVNNKYRAPENIILILFYSYTIILVSDAVLLVFTAFLGYGLYYERSNLFKYYLVCRFPIWLLEVIFISVLCLSHKLLIGYYLCILLFVVLEFYSFIVVYSYYVNIAEYEKEMECKEGIPCNTHDSEA